MMLLSDFIDKKEFLFLLTLLHLEYADYDYEIIPGSAKIHNQIVTVQFTRRASTLRYVSIQKTRKIRVAFSSLAEYAKKDNRNGYMYSTAKILDMKSRAFSLLSRVAEPLKESNRVLDAALSEDSSDADIEQFIASVDYHTVKQTPEYAEVRRILIDIMELVATELASNWDDPRYSREIADE